MGKMDYAHFTRVARSNTRATLERGQMLDTVRGKSRQRVPLSFHKASGQFYKRNRGKCYYFGKDKETAFSRFLAEY